MTFPPPKTLKMTICTIFLTSFKDFDDILTYNRQQYDVIYLFINLETNSEVPSIFIIEYFDFFCSVLNYVRHSLMFMPNVKVSYKIIFYMFYNFFFNS